MGMNIVCLDLEGVLAPEIWVAFAEKAGIPDLMRTTRDEPDYDKLMKFRLDVLRRHGMGLPQIQEVIADIQTRSRRQGVPGRPARADPGDHHQRHVRAVRPAPSWRSSAGRPSSATRWKSLMTAPSPATACAAIRRS